LVALGWWLIRGRSAYRTRQVGKELQRQVIAAAILCVTSWLTMTVLWPFVFVSPIRNLLLSIKVLSYYPYYTAILYDGSYIRAHDLPRTYTFTWLVIGSPPSLLILALLGLSVACVWCFKKRLIDPKIGLILGSLIVPLGAMFILHSVLYDALRQFLFLVPSIILLAVYGFVQTLQYLASRQDRVWRWAAVALAVLTLASYAQVAVEMQELSPFEYTYFSPLVGGLPGAVNQYESDYWQNCGGPAAYWLAQNYQHYTSSKTPSVNSSYYILPLLPSVFHKDTVSPDFYIAKPVSALDPAPFPIYQTIHVVAVEGVTFCTVQMNPALT
jgi:hypothetical protein